MHSLSLCDKAAHITADKVVKFNQPAISRSRLAMSLSREAARGIFYPRRRGKVLKRTRKIYEEKLSPRALVVRENESVAAIPFLTDRTRLLIDCPNDTGPIKAFVVDA